jgi:hypothetical protein
MPPTPEEHRDAVIREIEAAFDGITREGGVSLHEADVIDNYGTPAERDAARALDTENRWQDVPAGDIRTYHWVLPFLDPIGYRYYLPAYMTWSLTNLNSPRDTTSIDATIFSLTRGEDEKYEEWELDRFKTFMPVQSKAIGAFLRYLEAHAGGTLAASAKRALERYWATRQ